MQRKQYRDSRLSILEFNMNSFSSTGNQKYVQILFFSDDLSLQSIFVFSVMLRRGFLYPKCTAKKPRKRKESSTLSVASILSMVASRPCSLQFHSCILLITDVHIMLHSFGQVLIILNTQLTISVCQTCVFCLGLLANSYRQSSSQLLASQPAYVSWKKMQVNKLLTVASWISWPVWCSLYCKMAAYISEILQKTPGKHKPCS